MILSMKVKLRKLIQIDSRGHDCDYTCELIFARLSVLCDIADFVQDNAISKARADKYRDIARERVKRAIEERNLRIKKNGREPQPITINVNVAKWASGDNGGSSSNNHTSNKV